MHQGDPSRQRASLKGKLCHRRGGQDLLGGTSGDHCDRGSTQGPSGSDFQKRKRWPWPSGLLPQTFSPTVIFFSLIAGTANLNQAFPAP